MFDFSKLKPKKKPQADCNTVPDIPPLERLFQEVSARIYLENHNISLEPKRGPSCFMDDVQFHYGRHYGLLSFYQEMNEKLDELELEYDTLDLRQHLTYVEQYLHYVKAMVDCSYELMHYRDALAEAEAELLALDQQVHQTHSKAEFKVLEVGLEQILDTQDRLKSQYADFVFRGLDPVSVTPFYQAYLKKLEVLQDALDETRAWLG